MKVKHLKINQSKTKLWLLRKYLTLNASCRFSHWPWSQQNAFLEKNSSNSQGILEWFQTAFDLLWFVSKKPKALARKSLSISFSTSRIFKAFSCIGQIFHRVQNRIHYSRGLDYWLGLKNAPSILKLITQSLDWELFSSAERPSLIYHFLKSKMKWISFLKYLLIRIIKFTTTSQYIYLICAKIIHDHSRLGGPAQVWETVHSVAISPMRCKKMACSIPELDKYFESFIELKARSANEKGFLVTTGHSGFFSQFLFRFETTSPFQIWVYFSIFKL